MFSSRLNYFNRHEWVAGRDSGGLAGAFSKINRRLRALFDPYAAEEALRLRQTCSRLRAVPWATASSELPLESRSSSLWLEHYLKLKKGRYWGKDWCTYRNLASEYTIWNIKSRSKETTAERKKSKLVCYADSVEALYNERVDP
nr:hypothetical protein FVER53263_20535 [Fusarium verticillioides]